jgi:carbon-monoxide dehydrogenase large subunit
VFDPPWFTCSNGANVAVVEVDIETGQVKFHDYVFVHDCGTILNALVVEGQIHGGAAMGISAALFEEFRYDADGQPLVGSFMDYHLPTAADLPRLKVDHVVTPSPLIPGGMKGVGESGEIAPPAAVVNAVEDALRPFDVKFTRTPLTPDFILSAIADARREPSR